MERNLDIVRQIGCDLSEKEIQAIEFKVSEGHKKEIDNYFTNAFRLNNRPIIGIHPGAGKEKNIWYSKNFVQLIQELYEEFKFNLVITCGINEDKIVTEISNMLNNSGIKTLILKLTLLKLYAALSKLDLYITNDSGPMHIAGLTKTKTISLFGPTEPYEWEPIGKNNYFIKSKTDNINDIEVSEVSRYCRKLLADEISMHIDRCGTTE
jgi:heptosyltransferase-2